MNPELESEMVITCIEEKYPQLSLENTLLSEESDFAKMHPNEREFAMMLLGKGLVVFREPSIDQCLHTPDFFIYNQRSNSGKLVEITLQRKSLNMNGRSRRSILRKRRQIEELSNCGIPFVVLYREHMENIRRLCWGDLF